MALKFLSRFDRILSGLMSLCTYPFSCIFWICLRTFNPILDALWMVMFFLLFYNWDFRLSRPSPKSSYAIYRDLDDLHESIRFIEPSFCMILLRVISSYKYSEFGIFLITIWVPFLISYFWFFLKASSLLYSTISAKNTCPKLPVPIRSRSLYLPRVPDCRLLVLFIIRV